jgi:hypothetical protein
LQLIGSFRIFFTAFAKPKNAIARPALRHFLPEYDTGAQSGTIRFPHSHPRARAF